MWIVDETEKILKASRLGVCVEEEVGDFTEKEQGPD